MGVNSEGDSEALGTKTLLSSQLGLNLHAGTAMQVCIDLISSGLRLDIWSYWTFSGPLGLKSWRKWLFILLLGR
jgi:hypothetical protein